MFPSIDTLQIYDRLKKTFPEEQAHELSQVLYLIGSELATKEDIKELDVKTQIRFKELENRFKELENRFKELENRFKELELGIVETKTLIAQSKVETLKWTVGFLLAQTGVIAALVKFL